jgi:hypothetical protein
MSPSESPQLSMSFLMALVRVAGKTSLPRARTNALKSEGFRRLPLQSCYFLGLGVMGIMLGLALGLAEPAAMARVGALLVLGLGLYPGRAGVFLARFGFLGIWMTGFCLVP